MSNPSDDFFASKDNHPWSRIKDRILASYISPYTAKIVKKGHPLLYVDAFAGPGKTDKGEPGSPLLICQAAEKYARGNYQAIFVNKKKEYHEKLAGILQAAGWGKSATPILGEGQILLRSVVPLLSSQSVFLYIDPFGLDCEFDTLMPFLQRSKNYSTEILINLQAPILHRLAGREALIAGSGDKQQIAARHEKLSRTLGGDYWKEALLSNEDWDAKTREQMVVKGYREKLASTGYLIYTGACPVQASRDSATKYYMIFASPHPDAMFLLNDEMCKAFNEYMHEEEIRNTLFAGQHWTTWRNTSQLAKLVTDYVQAYPKQTRRQLWLHIIQDYFMLFMHSEYIKVVSNLVDTEKIRCTTPIGSSIRKTKRLNENCVLESGS